MPVHLPDFRQEFIQGIRFFSWIPKEVGDQLGAMPVDIFAKYQGVGDVGEVVVALQVEAFDDEDVEDYFVQLSVDRIEHAKSTEDLQEVDVETLKNRLALILQGESRAYSDAAYCVPRSALAPRGIIETLLGVSTTTVGTELMLTGGEFSLSGETYTRLTWSLDPLNTEFVKGVIEAEIDIEFNGDLVTRIADILQDGVECFILEGTKPHNYHAEDLRKKIASQKKA